MTTKVDFKKSMKEFYQPSSKEVVEINVPEMQFLMYDGMGSPGDSKEYQDALAALYPIAFKIKFLSKAKGKDFDPDRHEALFTEETDEVPDRTVLEEIEAGYMYRGVVLTPVKVKVSRFPQKEEIVGENGEEAEESN